MDILIGLIYLGFCYVVANAGDDTKIGFWGWWTMSFFCSPMVGFLILLLVRHEKG